MGMALAMLASACAGNRAAPGARMRTAPAVAPDGPGGTLRGIAIFWPDHPDQSLDVVRAKAARVMDYATSLEANAVSVSFAFYTDGLRSNSLHPGEETPSPERVAAVVAVAHDHGLHVTLRPLLDERILQPDKWRGVIEPTDPDRWFASYQQFLTPYLSMAQRAGVERFTIGSELTSMEADPRWNGLAAAARGLYHGALSYSANWGSYQEQAPPVPVRAGLDAYFPTTLADNASIDQVEAAWEDWFSSIRHRVDYRELVLDEVGIAAQQGAYRQPYQWGASSLPLDTTVQERWMTAAGRFARRHKVAGIYFWKLSLHTDPQHPEVTDSDRGEFAGRPAADAIRTCFQRL